MLSTLSSSFEFFPENMSRWNNKHLLPPSSTTAEVKRSLSAKEQQSVMGGGDLDMRARVECRHQRRSNWEILSGHRISATPTQQKPSENWDECSSLFSIDFIQRDSLKTSPSSPHHRLWWMFFPFLARFHSILHPHITDWDECSPPPPLFPSHPIFLRSSQGQARALSEAKSS